jgi:hypothetical protein
MKQLGIAYLAGGAAHRRLLRRPSSRQWPVRRERWLRSISRRASANGTTNWCTTDCGTWISRARPCWPISMWTAGPIKAVAQPTKQAFLYLFDRVSGQPIFPMEERTVEQTTVPGEKTSPTQPFPTKPPPYDTQGFTANDLIDFTPELRKQAEALVAHYRLGPVFTPPVVSKAPGPLATIAFGGGTNWPGGAIDPETGIAYVFSWPPNRPVRSRRGRRRRRRRFERFTDFRSGKPPYGQHHRHRSQPRRHPMADRAWRNAG